MSIDTAKIAKYEALAGRAATEATEATKGGSQPPEGDFGRFRRFSRDSQREGGVTPTAHLLNAVAFCIRQYVIVNDAQARAVALWVLHTWSFDAADATPYLSITSPEKESGKSRLLEILELLVARPWLTGRVTAAVLCRKVDKERPTLLLDESDAAFRSGDDYAEALRGILNTGHRRGGASSLCIGQGSNIDFKDFSTFAPKAIAGLGRLPDTVASRAIRIELKRKAPGEAVARFRHRKAAAETEPIREELERWAAEAITPLRDSEPDLPDALGDRAQDCWEPLLAIADLAEGSWPESARIAAVELSGRGAEDDDSLGVRLLADVRAAFDNAGTDRLATKDLLEGLRSDEEAPWAEWKGRGLTARSLSTFLHSFGIRSRTIRLDDETTPKGFLREQFEDAWASLYPPSQNATTPHPRRRAKKRPFASATR
jgi:Protein of unknown function (DUF3631)